MKLSLYQLDAFTDTLFAGNPAAVVPLDTWISDEVMQNIAAENNLAETAFYVPTETGYHIRWFTPTVEVDLCGHATLATAYVLFFIKNYPHAEISFDSKSGIVTAKGDEVDFVSRFFGPQSGINEDPVTGSAHTTLIPYWADRLKKKVLTARQVSARGGYLRCELVGDRTLIGGQVRLYMTGEISLD